MDEFSCHLPSRLLIETGVDQEVISLTHSEGVRSAPCQIRILFDSPGRLGADSSSTVPRSVSELTARTLARFTLSAWFPAVVFVAGVTTLLQFRRAGSVSVSDALHGLDSFQALIPMIALLIATLVITRAFSFETIRTLEGYWRRRGIAGLLRTLMIRKHVRKKEVIIKRRRKASQEALDAARPRMLSSGVPISIVNAFEAQVLGRKPPTLSGEDRKRFARMNWRSSCDAWRLARVDHLLTKEMAYPTNSRILPTRLGNLIRATEDRLQNTGGELEAFALRRHHGVPYRVQSQHDQFRNRLEMYCTLVFVSASLVILTPAVLFRSGIDLISIGIISGIFAACGVVSYLASLASAAGYCITLKEMDQIRGD